MKTLTTKERALFKKLSTPRKIQDFLDTLPYNYEKNGDTCRSVRNALKARKAHCIEGAFIAAAALQYHGHKPLILDFKCLPIDEDHVVTLYRINGYWGAISKTNHAIIRFRDPIYRTIRELALSYFHEYFMFENGAKTLRWYSRPLSLARFGDDWITGEDCWDIAYALDTSPHYAFVPSQNIHHLRPVPGFERKTLTPLEWKKEDPRT